MWRGLRRAGMWGGIRRVLYQQIINTWRVVKACSCDFWWVDGSGGRATGDRSPIEITVKLAGFTFAEYDDSVKSSMNHSVKNNYLLFKAPFCNIYFRRHSFLMYLFAYVVPLEMIKRKT